MWHVIITLEQQTRSYHVGCDMLAWTLGSIHGQMTSGVAYSHLPWKAYFIGRRRVWHAIIALGQHKRSENVACGMPSLPFESITLSDNIERGM